MQKQKVLIHICCAPDATVVAGDFKDKYDLVCHFYNPNIFPEEEYAKRAREMLKVSRVLGLPLFCDEYDVERWSTLVRGLEKEPEGCKRCEVCIKMRLVRAAQYALKNGFKLFTTVLTVSPHKDAKAINRIGSEIGEAYGIKFLEIDFKKNDGFKRSIELSKKFGLYRQNYCGCEYSLKKPDSD